jgi:hypothetical protein
MHRTTPNHECLSAIRRHLAETHGQAELDLHAQVSFPGHLADDEQIVFLPERPGTDPSFVCTRCHGHVFQAAAPTYGHPLRSALVLRTSPVLAALAHGLGYDERLALAAAYDRGQVGAELASLVGRREATRTRRSTRPSVDARREVCQQFLVAEVEDGAPVDQALVSLAHAAAEDPVRYGQVVGGAYRPLSRDAYRSYWRALPPHVRAQALARSRARRRAA